MQLVSLQYSAPPPAYNAELPESVQLLSTPPLAPPPA
jgi:hypothetical protein